MRQTRNLRLTACAVGVVALALAASALAAPAPKDPSRMVVQLRDLPAGFAVTSRRDRPTTTVAKETGVKLALLRSWGRVGGYEAAYDLPVDPADPPRGAAMVTSTVSTYATDAGLVRAYAASVERIGRLGKPRHVPRPFPGALGDAVRLWETRFSQDGLKVALYTIVWRSHGALSHVAVAGVAGRITVADAIAIARRQQTHVRIAARPVPPAPIA